MGNSAASTLSGKGDRQESRYHLQVTVMKGTPTLGVGAQPFPLTFTEGDAKAFNHKFISILEELGSDVIRKGVDLTSYDHNYLIRLRNTGKAAYNTFLHSSTRQYFQKKEEAEQQRGGLSLTFQTPIELSFFWEMLYAGKPEIEPEQFWGFRYPIGRTYWGEFDLSDRVQLQSGILSAIHHKLKYSLQEVEQVGIHLQNACQRLRLKLSLQLLEQIISAESLCQDSFIDTLLELFNDPDFSYGIIHFACHCWQSQNEPGGESVATLWVGTSSGLFRYRPTVGLWDGAWNFASGELERLSIQALALDPITNRLWIGTSMGLFSEHTWQKHREVDVQALAFDPEGALWLGTATGLEHWVSPGEGKWFVGEPTELFTTGNSGLAANVVTALCTNKLQDEFLLWVGSSAGVSCYPYKAEMF
ncbi:hypothetical protein F7734_10910 [Scytonema sp. UIC 10036]|uniref:hypothetical protein n=1 Tax=Scytonema sp. UIC 10036 TaxID=2304196 RepID=UPI0012DA7D75|nr:hypothetical protein [Scytonema sp. UIC 10036]MUG92924.1 hypothetical protein [Scytonema sp. UIC 10036]